MHCLLGSGEGADVPQGGSFISLCSSWVKAESSRSDGTLHHTPEAVLGHRLPGSGLYSYYAHGWAGDAVACHRSYQSPPTPHGTPQCMQGLAYIIVLEHVEGCNNPDLCLRSRLLTAGARFIRLSSIGALSARLGVNTQRATASTKTFREIARVEAIVKELVLEITVKGPVPNREAQIHGRATSRACTHQHTNAGTDGNGHMSLRKELRRI